MSKHYYRDYKGRAHDYETGKFIPESHTKEGSDFLNLILTAIVAWGVIIGIIAL